RFRLGTINGQRLEPNRDDFAARTNADGPLLLFLPATRAKPADYVRITAPQQGCEAVARGAEFFCDYAVRAAQELPQLGPTEERREDAWRKGGYRIQTTLDLDLNGQQKDLID
ncbi:hypothetical protein IAE22_32940, partial [Bacillus sp. S34]|nr:hypothetical protein [Bacillus sp. S34]